jgi:hypothetical protein
MGTLPCRRRDRDGTGPRGTRRRRATPHVVGRVGAQDRAGNRPAAHRHPSVPTVGTSEETEEDAEVAGRRGQHVSLVCPGDSAVRADLGARPSSRRARPPWSRPNSPRGRTTSCWSTSVCSRRPRISCWRPMRRLGPSRHRHSWRGSEPGSTRTPISSSFGCRSWSVCGSLATALISSSRKSRGRQPRQHRSARSPRSLEQRPASPRPEAVRARVGRTFCGVHSERSRLTWRPPAPKVKADNNDRSHARDARRIDSAEHDGERPGELPG